MRAEVAESERIDERLAEALAALASPARLAMLRQTSAPKLLPEIRAGAPPDVREHLDLLLAAGVVTPRETEREHGPAVEYALNAQALFAIAEEIRDLARARPTTAAGVRAGPRLVLVKGIGEGRAFDLAPPADGAREWVIGRRRGLDVTLDFDPFVSTQNAVVKWERGAHHVADLPESRNGTSVNFAPLPAGEWAPLAPGDVVGVGRSLLVYRA